MVVVTHDVTQLRDKIVITVTKEVPVREVKLTFRVSLKHGYATKILAALSSSLVASESMKAHLA